MKIIKKEEIKNEIKYIVESDAKIWKNAQELSYKALSKKLKLSGFRSGHVPSEVAKKYISEQEVMNHSLKKTIDENYRLLLQAKDFESEKVIEDALTVDIAEINPKFLRIVYAFEKFPDVTIGDYKKIKINYAEPKIQSEDVEREITRYTKKDIMLVPKDTDIIAKGDMVNFDFKGFIDGKPFAGGEAKGHELEIGSNSFIPGFEEQMIGLKKDDKKTIEVTFPKDYHSKDLANKKAKFELVINDIKIIQKPELNDEYIARFAIPDVKTDEQFKKYVHNQLHEHKKYSARQEAIKEISQWLIEHTKLSYIPKSLLDEEIKRLNNDINKRALEVKVDKEKYITTYLGYQNLKDFEKVLEESAIKNLQLVIGIEKIIDELKIDISEKETEEHLTKMAKVYGMTLDMLKQRLNNNYDGIKTVLIQEKVFDKLIEINK